MALGDIGPAAGAAVPALLQALNVENPRTRIAMAGALWKIGRHPAAVSELIRQLSATDWEIRSTALDVLAEIGVGAPTAVPALTAMLTTDDEPRIRQQAAGVLWQVARSREVIAVHLEGLKSETLWMRSYAATFLGEMGWAARETVPQIVDALLVSSDHEQERMARALTKIDPDATLTVPELVKAIKHDKYDRQLRGAAARTIAAFRLTALPEMSRLHRDGDSDSALLTALACYWIGPSSIDFLAELVESQNAEVREAAAGTLATFENVTSSELKNRIHLKAVPILIRRFVDSDSSVRAAVDDSLYRIGTDALPALRTLLEHESHNVRDRAADLIERIEAESGRKD
jgi:HEAT repeat protein